MQLKEKIPFWDVEGRADLEGRRAPGGPERLLLKALGQKIGGGAKKTEGEVGKRKD